MADVLHTRSWGTGDQVAVLVHGMFGESRQFWEVGPALAERGYRAVAVDLTGHGLSGPSLVGGLEEFAAALVASVPGSPAMVLGHSLGAMVAAAALETLVPRCAVYVDVPFRRTGGSAAAADVSALRAALEETKRTRTEEWLARTRPWWKPHDCQVEAEAVSRFDVSAAVVPHTAIPQGSVGPPHVSVPSLLIHADPSDYVTPERLEELRSVGFATRGVAGAGHSVWYGHFEEFMAALDDGVNLIGRDALCLNTWHHVVGTWGAAGAQLRVDRITVGRMPDAALTPAEGSVFRVHGSVDESGRDVT